MALWVTVLDGLSIASSLLGLTSGKGENDDESK